MQHATRTLKQQPTNRAARARTPTRTQRTRATTERRLRALGGRAGGRAGGEADERRRTVGLASVVTLKTPACISPSASTKQFSVNRPGVACAVEMSTCRMDDVARGMRRARALGIFSDARDARRRREGLRARKARTVCSGEGGAGRW